MNDELSRKNNHLEEYNLSVVPEDILHSNPPGLITDSDSGDNGEGGVGTSTLSVEELAAYQQAAFNMDRRQRNDGQKKFANCPFSENPNNLLGKKNSSSSCGLGESLQKHPLLSQSSQFSGIDPKLSPNPTENSEAHEQFQHKLENQYRKNLGLGASKNIVPVR